MNKTEEEIKSIACADGYYCSKCDDAYFLEIGEICPECSSKMETPIPETFYESHSECFEVAKLIYEQDPTSEDHDSGHNAVGELEEVLSEAVKLLRALRDPSIDETGARWVDEFMDKYGEVIKG